MNIKLIPVSDENREAILALSVREDQPFVASNDVSLRQADEVNEEAPGVARPFGIYADDRLVGFCMFAFDPDDDDVEDRYYLWRFMIDKDEQGKGYGQAALEEIIRYFRDNGADRLYLSTEPENELGLHVYHKAGFRETGVIGDGEAVLMRMLKGPRRVVRGLYGIDVDSEMRIRGKRGYGISIAVSDSDGDIATYCSGTGRTGQNFPVNPDMLFQAGSVSKPMFALTLLRYADKGMIDVQQGSKTNEHVSAYSSKRDGDTVDLKKLISETAAGVIEIDWDTFIQIGNVAEDWDLDTPVFNVGEMLGE